MVEETNWYITIVEGLTAIIYVDSSGEGNAAVYVSPQAEGMLGYAPEQWFSDAGLWKRILHPDDRERVLSESRRARERAEPFTVEYHLASKDGRVVWVRDEAAPVVDESQEITVWRGIMLDITASRELEEELRESERRFDSVFTASEVGMAEVSLDGRWLRVNDALCEMLGYGRGELLSMTFWDITPEQEMDSVRERVASLLSGKLKSYSVERQFVCRSGYRIWVEVGISLVLNFSGKTDYFFGRFRDVTERRLAELVPEKLTDGELEVLRLLSKGNTNQQIADELRYSVGNIKHRVQAIIRKLGVENRREAVIRAEEIGLVPNHYKNT